MTQEEKRELKDGVISIFRRFNILDHTATIGGLRDDILKYINSLQEEPKSEVWHTMDKEPPQDSNICLLWPRDNIITIGKLNGLKDFRYVSKWAYAESILNLKEEPVSNDFESALAQEWKGYNDRGAATVDALEDNTQELAFAKGFYRGAKWGKNQAKVEIQAQSMALAHGCPKESTTEDLGKYINELSKQFPEVSFAKMSRIAVRVAKWQIAQIMKDAIEVTVHIEAGNYPYIPQMELYDYDKDVPLAKEGDKYKVILIKKE